MRTPARWPKHDPYPKELDEPIVDYLPGDGRRFVRHTLAEAADADVDWEAVRQSRPFIRFKGMRNFPGLYWMSKSRRLVPHESWLERDRLMIIDHQRSTTGAASQPFLLLVPDENGTPVHHYPDYLVTRQGQPPLIVDVKNSRDVAAFAGSDEAALTEWACRTVGWDYQIVSQPDPQVMANVRWLAGYRRPAYDPHGWAGQLVQNASAPAPIGALAASVDDPVLTLPVLFHLLWSQRLRCDLTKPLRASTLVTQ